MQSRRSLIGALAGTLVLLPALAKAAPEASDETDENLVRIERAKVKLAFVRPGVDWKKYKTIVLLPLSIPPEARDAAPQGATTRMGESYLLKDSDVQTLKERFDRVMREELGKSQYFKLINEPQADSIIIATAIAKLVIAAPLETSRLGYAGRSRTYTPGAGAATIATAIADGTDFTILARIIDNRYAPNTWSLNTVVSNLADLDIIYGGWGRYIRTRLDDIQAGKIKLP